MWWFSTDKDIVKEWAMWASDEKKKKFFKEETAGFPTKMVWSWPLVSGNQLQLSSWGLHDQTWAALTLVMEGMGCRTDHNIASPFSNRNLSLLWNKPLSSSAQSTFLKLTNETPSWSFYGPEISLWSLIPPGKTFLACYSPEHRQDLSHHTHSDVLIHLTPQNPQFCHSSCKVLLH